MITDHDIPMLPIFSDDAKDLLEGLLNRDVIFLLLMIQPKKRLGSGPEGINEIKDHDFYMGIDWVLLEQKKISPPFVPQIESELDLKNIDRVFTREPARETPDVGDRPLRKAKFDNFTYMDENNILEQDEENELSLN